MNRLGAVAIAAGLVMAASPAFALDVASSVKTDAKPAAVWQTIGSFCDISKWHPAVEKCVESDANGAKRRTLTLAGGGGTLVEEQVSRDDAKMTYTYKIVEGPLPVENYQSTISVTPAGDGSDISWTGTFDAKGASDDDAKKVIRGIYESGLQSIAAKASGK
ncbi:SRPBCC family protein [Jiella sp. M17.18]|uniref:SRPBCC family protein n=1 Tax=Jiella sp. M17.18 TaxID=3234247 RepID=UPI0034DE840D